MMCASNFSRLVPQKDVLHANCSRESFTGVGILSGGGIPLSGPYFSCTVLLIVCHHAEERVKNGNQPVAVDLQKGETLKALQTARCKAL